MAASFYQKQQKYASLVEAMMRMKKIMEANAVAIAATSVVAKVNPTSPSGINESSNLRYGRQRFGKYGRPP